MNGLGSPAIHRHPPHTSRASASSDGKSGFRAILGIDCEWVPGTKEVSVIQLATEHACLVFSLAAAGGGLPAALKGVLVDSDVVKVGKALATDVKLLAWDLFGGGELLHDHAP